MLMYLFLRPEHLVMILEVVILVPQTQQNEKNFSVVRNLDSELSRLEESQRQNLEKLLQKYEVLFPDVSPTTDQTYHGIDRRISLILLNKKRKRVHK